MEDDQAGALVPGAVEFAVNAGGAGFADESGVVYEADVDGNWIGASNQTSDSAANQPANGDYTGDGVRQCR